MANSGSGKARQMRDSNRTHEPVSANAPQRGRLAVIDAREESMQAPFGRKFYLRRGGIDMAPIGLRRAATLGTGLKMIPLGEVPDVARILPTALRMLGPDYLVPKNPDDSQAQRSIVHHYSWGEMPNISISAKRSAKTERKDKEAKDSKRAKAKGKKMG